MNGRCAFLNTNITSNVLKLRLVGNELLLGWDVDAHVAREPDWWRSHPDVDLSRRIIRLLYSGHTQLGALFRTNICSSNGQK